jgi:hypothetical protein
MSAFKIEGTFYMAPSLFGNDLSEEGDQSTDIPSGSVLSLGMDFSHEYDFGSSTYLDLKVTGQRESRFKGPLRLLSRNNPHAWQCHQCGKSAEWVNSQDIYDSDNPFYCDFHMKQHPDNDYAFLPVVNSPRMGVCAYGT